MTGEHTKKPSIYDLLDANDYEEMGDTKRAEAVRNGESIELQELEAERMMRTDYNDGVNLPKTPNMRVLRGYQDYFDLGAGRTIAELHRRYAKTAEIYGKEAVPTTSLNVLYRWKRYYEWDIQVRADELDLFEQSRATKKEGARKMVERQTGYARVAQTIGYNFLRSMLDEFGNLTEEGKKVLTPAEARRFILDGSKLEMDLYGGSKDLLDDGDEISYE